MTGSDELFARLVTDVPWQAERRQMWDNVVDVPRLLRFYGEHEPLPDPLLTEARDALDRHYAAELGEPFTTAGMCFYRDGRDSVAWHGDTHRPQQHAGHHGRDPVARRGPPALAAAADAAASRSRSRSATATCW